MSGQDSAYETRKYNDVYSTFFLTTGYDYYVLGFNLRYFWRCNVDSVLFPFFCDSFSDRHLDCGVATGYFPATALKRLPRKDQQLTLLDLNVNSLHVARDRILSDISGTGSSVVTPIECIQADITAPLPKELEGKKFSSISMFNLFHCVPGPSSVKFRAVGVYKEVLDDDGVLYGCSVLGNKAPSTTWWTRLYLGLVNWSRGFHNENDVEEDFRKILDENFAEVETQVVGQVLLFKTQKPRRG